MHGKKAHDLFTGRKIVSVLFYCLITLLYALPFQASAQPGDWELRNYNISDGLSSNTVTCFEKDARGFLWIGTSNGLNRFDGYSFTSILLPSGEKHELSRIKTLSLLNDRDGILWVGTVNGLFRYDPTQASTAIQKFQYLSGETGIAAEKQPVRLICQDQKGRLWFTCMDLEDFTNYGLRYFDPLEEKFTYVRIDSTFSGDPDKQSMGYVADVSEDPEGYLWLGTSSGIVRYSEVSDRTPAAGSPGDTPGTFHAFVPYETPQNPLQNQTLVFEEDQVGNAWAGSRFGLFSFDKATGTFGDPVLLDTVAGCYGAHSDVYFIGQDADGYLWLRVNFSLIRVRPLPGGKLDIAHMTKHYFPVKDFKLNSLVATYIENPSMVWVAVPGYGIYQVFIRRKAFQADLPGFGAMLPTGNRTIVTAVYEDDQRQLWVATSDSGAVCYGPDHQHPERCMVNPTEFINAINQDAYGNLWFVSRYGVASRKEGDHFVHYRANPSDPGTLTLRDDAKWEGIATLSAEINDRILLKDQQGSLWINSGKAVLDLYDPGSDRFYHLDVAEPGTYNNERPTRWSPGQERLLPNSRGLLRISGPITKADHFQLRPQQTILYVHDPDDSLSISSDHVLDVLVSKHYQPGTIWIATMDGGLDRLEVVHDEAEKADQVQFRNYSEKDGLCDNAIMGILEDSLGCLWLATHNGLSRFDPSTGVFNNFYEIDGLPADHFTCANPCVSHDGYMNFATESGLLRFHPASIRNNESIPPVALTSFMIFNQPVIPGEGGMFSLPVTAYDRLDLQYDQNFLSFEFAALNYELPEKNMYRYRLEGLDQDWIFAGGRHYVEYPGLRSGKYTFHVAASNNDGYWNNDGLSLTFRIAPPPWFTWYAFLVYGCILLMAILAYRRFILSRARLETALGIERVEKEKIREMEKVKSRFFANISHEFRTPLTLITGPVNNLLKNTKEQVSVDRQTLGMIARNAKRLQRLINQLLEAARLESGELKLQVSYGDPLESIRIVAADFASLASSKNITLSVDDPERTSFCYFDRDKIEKVLYNLLSNAVKFTQEGGTVFLAVRLTGASDEDPEQLEMIVRDNGKGIPADQLEDIYKPFYQVNYSDASEAEGTGLGLSLTRELVRLHRGTIHVESILGEGTAFTVRFPVSQKAFRPDEIRGDGESDAPPEGTANVGHHYKVQAMGPSPQKKQHKDSRMVLVAEDNADLREYISGILSRYHVIAVENGKQAWEATVRNLPDLVVTDVMMPGMSGLELCRSIREDMRTSHIPVIMLTAKANFDTKLEGLNEGADDYLVKPFDADELQLRIRNMLLQRQKLQERTRDILLNTNDYTEVLDEHPFLSRVFEVMEAHYADEHLRMDDIAEELHLSRSQFYRKTQSEAGTSPNELLRKLRIDRSAQLLQSGKYNVAQAMYASGFQSTSNFSRSFRKYKGMNPSAYKKSCAGK